MTAACNNPTMWNLRAPALAMILAICAAFDGLAAQSLAERVARAEHLIQNGRDAEAQPGLADLKRELSGLVNADPKNPSHHFLLSKVLYYLGGDDAAALASATRAVELSPDAAEYRLWKATTLLATNMAAAAVVEIREACRLAPERIEYTASLVSALAAAKQFDEAENVLGGLIEREPKNGRWLGMRADLLAQAGDAAGSEQCLRRAIEVDPGYYNGWYNLGQLLQGRAKVAEALAMFESACALKPEELAPRAKMMQCFQALNRLPERDKAREEVFALYAAGKGREAVYCRDLFEMSGKQVTAFEYFEPAGVRAVRYSFTVADKSGKKAVETVSLGSYEAITLLARQKGQIGRNERLYHLDRYYPGGHAVYGMFKVEPTYDQVRAMVIEMIEGKRQPLANPAPPK